MRSEVYIQCSNHGQGGGGDQSFTSDMHLKQRALCSLADLISRTHVHFISTVANCTVARSLLQQTHARS